MARTLLLALLPFARCHGSKPGVLQPETSYADALWKLNDWGAEFASTSPLVGRTIPFNWTDAVLETFPTAACAALEAAVDRHAFYFDDSSISQQPMERQFMKNVSHVLCANPRQSDDEYTEILHGMLQTARDAITRHVNSAFYIKYVGAVMGKRYNISQLIDIYEADSGLSEGCVNPSGTEGVCIADTLPVLSAVLKHEKYNLAEGFYFLNMSYFMLEQGSAFCRDPNLGATLDKMSTGLEATLSYHSGNAAFVELLDDMKAQLCTEPDDNETDWQRTYDAWAQAIDDVVLGEQNCSFTYSSFARMPFLGNQFPDANDLITMIEGNTKVALAASTSAVIQTMESTPCVDAYTQQADNVAAARIVAKLQATGMPVSLFPRSKTQEASALPKLLTIPTVYHKLALTCLATTQTFSDVCVDEFGNLVDGSTEGYAPSEVDANPIFDLATSTSLATCSGQPCKNAARAVVAYQSLLGVITPMRWDAAQLLMGTSTPPGSSADVLNQSTWTFQRSCQASEKIVERAAYIQARLPDVIAQLRAAAPQLESTCVSPPRDLTVESPGAWAPYTTALQ